MNSPPRAVAVVGLFLWLALSTAGANLVISEFLAANDGFLLDEDGESVDWIEIWNPSSTSIDIDGYSLTDDPGAPRKWIFPSLLLAPGEFLLVHASGKDRRHPPTPLHTNFSLESQGEYLALFPPDASLPVSAFTPYPPQRDNVAYGMAADRADDLGYLTIPTPAQTNGDVVLGFVADTKFSAHRGFYHQPVTVAITCDTEDVEIRYTLDGSLPSPDHGEVYTAPLTLEHTTILRAVALRDRYVSSNVDTQTYLFPQSVASQPAMDPRVTTAPAYTPALTEALGNTLPAVSIVFSPEELFGPDGIYVEYERRGRGAEVPVSLEYFSPTDPDDRFHLAAGLRIHGGNARSHPKKPLRLYFREEYSGGELEHSLFPGSPVDCFEQLVLRSGGHDSWSLADRFGGSDFDLPAHATYLRDQFLRRTEHELGMLTPQGKYVHVYLNGDYWGIYDLHERPSAAFFSDHLGGGKNEWDVIHHPELNAEDYSVASGSSEAWRNLQHLATTQGSDTQGLLAVQEWLDLDHYMDALIIRMWSGDYDWCGPIFRKMTGRDDSFQNVTVFSNKNWYAGRRSRGNTGDNEPFHFFTWDAEMSMGLHLMYNLFGNTSQRVIDFDLSGAHDPGTPVAPYEAFVHFPPFRRAFADRLHKHLGKGGILSGERTQPRLQALIDELTLPVIAESARWGNTSPNGRIFTRDDDWLPEVEWLRDRFLIDRGEAMLDGFRARGIYPLPDPPELGVAGGPIGPEGRLSLTVPDGEGTIYYTTDGSDPVNFPPEKLLDLLPANASCRWLIPNPSNGGTSSQFRWTIVNLEPNPTLWWNGTLGLGYDQGDQRFRDLITTDVGESMTAAQGQGLFCRIPFSIPSQKEIDEMEAMLLRLRYDDGFVAYINGVKAASSNAPTHTTGRSTAVSRRSDEAALVEETFEISRSVRSRLVVGQNLLAVHVLNSDGVDDDLLLLPRLQIRQRSAPASPSATAQKLSPDGFLTLQQAGTVKARIRDAQGSWSALTEGYFYLHPPPQPGDIVITEIHYHPSPPRTADERAAASTDTAFEFLELTSRAEHPIDLEGAAFTQGIRFSFPPLPLQPGQRVLLVNDERAFRSRYGDAIAGTVLGSFDRDTRLSDAGERLTLTSRDGQTLLSFVYQDRHPWPREADGGGGSLVFRPAAAQPDPADPGQWTVSLDPDGYPGAEDSLRTYASWQARYFTVEERQATLDAVDGDPDGDEIPNLMEYARGTHPRQAEAPGAFMSFVSVNAEAGGPLPVFQGLLRPFTEDLQFTLDLSTDLQSWSALPVPAENPLESSLIRGHRLIQIPLPTPLGPTLYARLHVALNP